MKALVAIKRVLDYSIQVRVKPDQTDVDLAGSKMSINPFDEVAIEEALRLKEAGIVSEIVTVTIGASVAQDVLRHALAMGVDRVTLLETDAAPDSLGVAKLLAALVKDEQPGLILLGKQAIDDDAAQAGAMLSALLGWPQASAASKIVIADGKALVTREIDGGTQTVQLTLPAVITTDLRLNDPRFVKLPNLMMAKKKPINTVAADSLGVPFAARQQQVRVSEPAQRPAGVLVKSVAELVAALKAKGALQ